MKIVVLRFLFVSVLCFQCNFIHSLSMLPILIETIITYNNLFYKLSIKVGLFFGIVTLFLKCAKILKLQSS